MKRTITEIMSDIRTGEDLPTIEQALDILSQVVLEGQARDKFNTSPTLKSIYVVLNYFSEMIKHGVDGKC